MKEKPFAWLRIGGPQHAMEQGATLEDLGEIMRTILDALAAGQSIPKDRFGLHEFIVTEEPLEDH